MSAILTPSLARERYTTIRRQRELPALGKILANKGSIIKSSDSVASAELQGDLIIIRVSEQLGIEPFEVIKGLKVKQGDFVNKGDLICDHVGLFGIFHSKLYSPEAGLIELVSEKTGHICLRLPSRSIEIAAYISGTAVEIVPNKAITIEGQGAFIQGIFGVGGERVGKLKKLNVAADEIVTEDKIPEAINGMILFGGAKPTISALKKASTLGAIGLIVGSIDDLTLADYLGYDIGIALTGNEKISLTIIVTEGFGQIAMSEQVTQLLSEFDGFEASINGATQVRAGAIRPEVFIPHARLPEIRSADGGHDLLERSLNIDSRIRIIRVPYFGEIMTVTAMPNKAEKIETGAETRVLRAKRQDGTIVTVPRANVELV